MVNDSVCPQGAEADPRTDEMIREVSCSKCGGDGGWSVPIGIDHLDGSLLERVEACEACEATGLVFVEMEPVTEEEIMEPRS